MSSLHESEQLLDIIIDMQKEYRLRKFEVACDLNEMKLLGEFQKDLLQCVEDNDFTSGVMMFGMRYEDYIAMINKTS